LRQNKTTSWLCCPKRLDPWKTLLRGFTVFRNDFWTSLISLRKHEQYRSIELSFCDLRTPLGVNQTSTGKRLHWLRLNRKARFSHPTPQLTAFCKKSRLPIGPLRCGSAPDWSILIHRTDWCLNLGLLSNLKSTSLFFSLSDDRLCVYSHGAMLFWQDLR